MRKKNLALLLTLLLICSCVSWPAENEQRKESSYISNPSDIVNEFMRPFADFWKKARDNKYGGFYSFMDENGQLTDNKSKPFNSQSRIAYGFARTFMVTGDLNYLDQAEHALNFLYKYGWDQKNGGWYFSSDRKGTISPIPGEWSPNDRKWSFLQHYALLGPIAMIEATRSRAHHEWFRKGRASLEKGFWDSRPEFFGYYNWNSLEMSRPEGKGFTPTADAVTTHALAEYLINEDAESKERLDKLAANMVRLVDSRKDEKVNLGFAEEYDNDWKINYSAKECSVGHVIKVSWCLARVYMIHPNPQFKEAAFNLIDHMIAVGGLDENYVPNGAFKWDDTNVDPIKDFWMVEQGFVAGMTNYHIQSDPRKKKAALKMAKSSLDFFFKNFVKKDEVNGQLLGVNGVVDSTGRVLDRRKAHQWKAFYHVQELAYYAYVYSSLYLNKHTVDLYYYFDKTSDKKVKLTPIPFDTKNYKMIIKAVERNGESYSNFDKQNREIDLTSGKFGVFKVTFALRNL